MVSDSSPRLKVALKSLFIFRRFREMDVAHLSENDSHSNLKSTVEERNEQGTCCVLAAPPSILLANQRLVGAARKTVFLAESCRLPLSLLWPSTVTASIPAELLHERWLLPSQTTKRLLPPFSATGAPTAHR